MFQHNFPAADTSFIYNCIESQIAFERKYSMLPLQNIEFSVYPDRVVLNKYDATIKAFLDLIYDKYQLALLKGVIDRAW